MNNWHNHKGKKLTIIFTCAVIFFAQLFAENMVGNQSQNEGILVLPAPQKVTVDGDLKDWDLSGRIWIFADKAVRDRYSVKLSAMWDKDNLYLAARWNDPTPMHSIVDPDINPEHGWRSDAWQACNRYNGSSRMAYIEQVGYIFKCISNYAAAVLTRTQPCGAGLAVAKRQILVK
jgi:hypothetical protein